VLAAGHDVVATGRDLAAVANLVGEANRLLVARLDVTSSEEAETSVTSAVARFGRVDVLVNNAGSSFKGISRS
jgi:NADP-dependent 3-hydroxy acid dehydrogenase YdfG